MTKTCICDACGRVSTMTEADERSHCCGSTMHVLFENATEIFIPSYAFGTDFIAVIQHGKVVDLLLASDRRSIRGYLELGRVQSYIDRLDLGYEARNKNDIAVKEGNNVYVVRLVQGVPHILIRVDQRDDYTSCDDLLSPYERERIIDLALGQNREYETRRSKTGNQPKTIQGGGGSGRFRVLSTSLRHKLEPFFRALDTSSR